MGTSSWAEKYRPRTLDDVIGNEDIIEQLKGFAKDGSFPHLLFYGPPGVGKTTAAYCLCYDAFGFDADVVEMNASEYGLIGTIRNEADSVMSRASLKMQPLKVFILDEADNMSAEAQQALRRKMEVYEANCKLILIANDESKIIAPMWDRVSDFHFHKIPKKTIYHRCRMILKKEEKLEAISKLSLRNVVKEANGSMRKAINRLEGLIGHSESIADDRVERLTLIYPEKKARELLQVAMRDGFDAALRVMQDNGFTSPRMFFSMISKELHSKHYSESEKKRLAKGLKNFGYFNEQFYVYSLLAEVSK